MSTGSVNMPAFAGLRLILLIAAHRFYYIFPVLIREKRFFVAIHLAMAKRDGDFRTTPPPISQRDCERDGPGRIRLTGICNSPEKPPRIRWGCLWSRERAPVQYEIRPVGQIEAKFEPERLPSSSASPRRSESRRLAGDSLRIRPNEEEAPLPNRRDE